MGQLLEKMHYYCFLLPRLILLGCWWQFLSSSHITLKTVGTLGSLLLPPRFKKEGLIFYSEKNLAVEARSSIQAHKCMYQLHNNILSPAAHQQLHHQISFWKKKFIHFFLSVESSLKISFFFHKIIKCRMTGNGNCRKALYAHHQIIMATRHITKLGMSKCYYIF